MAATARKRATRAASDIEASVTELYDETLTALALEELVAGFAVAPPWTVAAAPSGAPRFSPSSSQLPQWPFLVFLLTAAFCLFLSTLYHTFGCAMGRRAFALYQGLDFAGIVTLIWGSCVPVLYYGFRCDTASRNCWMALSTAVGFTLAASVMTRKFRSEAWHAVRLASFIGFGFVHIVPILQIARFERDGELFLAFVWYGIAPMGGLYLAGAAVYANNIPERWYPGKVDLVGNSHQLFHVLVVAAATVHYAGVLTWMGELSAIGQLAECA